MSQAERRRQNRRGSGATGGFNPFAWYEENKNVNTGFTNGGIGVIPPSGQPSSQKPAATPQAPESPAPSRGLPANYAETERQAGQTAEAHRPGAGFSQRGATPAPNGGSGTGTRTSPRPMTMDEANKLLTGGYTIQNPFESNQLPATSASLYHSNVTDIGYDRELPENMFIQEGDLKLAANAFDAGSGVEYGQNLPQLPANGSIEYQQQAGAPLTVGQGAISVTEANENAQKPEINKIPPRPRGERQGEMWDRKYGRMNQTPEREKSDLEKGYKPDMDRRRAFLDAKGSMQGLRRVEAQKGIVYQGQQHYMVNPNAGQEGQNDFIAIDKSDRDAYMRGDQGAQDLKSKYVDKIKAGDQKLTDTAPENFTTAAQSPTSPIDSTAQVDTAQITNAPDLTQQVDVRFTDKDKTGRYNSFIKQ